MYITFWLISIVNNQQIVVKESVQLLSNAFFDGLTTIINDE